MKSILPVLSFAGLSLALAPCSQQYVTKTETEKVTVTVTPKNGDHHETSAPMEYVTSTTEIISTVTVTASPSPYYPIANGTGILSGTATAPPHTYSAEYSASIPAELADIASSTYVPGPFTASSTDVPDNFELFTPTSIAETPDPSPSATTAAWVAASPVPVSSNANAVTGEATFYGGNVAGGMCSFNGGFTIPAGIFGTALSDSNWEGANNCGACVAVTGPNGKTIEAMIVDQCPTCGPNHLDLFADAFASLAPPSTGIIPISYSIIPCGITTPLILKNKEGTSPYWFSMQVMNANVKVSKLEVSVDGGKSWKATARQPYNYFEESSGFGTQVVDVRVTSVSGGVVVVRGVSVEAGKQTRAGSNFS